MLVTETGSFTVIPEGEGARRDLRGHGRAPIAIPAERDGDQLRFRALDCPGQAGAPTTLSLGSVTERARAT